MVRSNWSAEAREAARRRMNQRWDDPAYRERVLPFSPQQREKLRLAALGNRYSAGRHPSVETRAKMSQVQLGNRNALGNKHGLGNKNATGHKVSTEARATMGQAALERWQNREYREKMRQARLNPTPEYREKMRQVRLRQTFPNKMTSIELTLYTEFKKRRLKFEMHKTMFGRFQPDFVFEQAHLIVEADGDYWHSLPNRREGHERMAEMAHAEGWSLWRFGEKEIQIHGPVCARAVARFVRDHRQAP